MPAPADLRNLSVLEYLYRDAGNYKAFGELLLSGSWSCERSARIENLVGSDGWFVAEQIGAPPLYAQLWAFSDGPTEDDHPFHEVLRLRPAIDEDLRLELWGDLETLEQRLEEAVRRPRPDLSPHSSIDAGRDELFSR